MTLRRAKRTRGRSALLWGLIFLVSGQAGLAAFLRCRHPDIIDPGWAVKCASLRARMTEATGRPLVVFLGSSRPLNCVRPDLLVSDEGPCVFNLALPAYGPVRQLLAMRHLLADGIRPHAVVIEVWGPMLPQDGAYAEEHIMLEGALTLTDLPTLLRCCPSRWAAFQRTVATALAPAVVCRQRLLARFAPSLLRPEEVWFVGRQQAIGESLDGWGWQSVTGKRLGGPEQETLLRLWADHVKSVLHELRVSPVTDFALRELVRLCAQHGVRPMLVLLPDHPITRQWSAPEAQARLLAYLAGLSYELGVPVIDAQDWIPPDAFADYAHPACDGATIFTERFGREVLRPWLAGAAAQSASATQSCVAPAP